HARHGLDAAGEDEVLESAADLLCREVDGLETRSAEPVDLDASDRLVEAGHEGGRAGDVAALLTDRWHDTEHEVVDGFVIEFGVALAHGVDEPGHEVDGFDAVERTVAVLAAWGAHRVIDERFAHVFLTVFVEDRPANLIDRSVTFACSIVYQFSVTINTPLTRRFRDPDTWPVNLTAGGRCRCQVRDEAAAVARESDRAAAASKLSGGSLHSRIAVARFFVSTARGSPVIRPAALTSPSDPVYPTERAADGVVAPARIRISARLSLLRVRHCTNDIPRSSLNSRSRCRVLTACRSARVGSEISRLSGSSATETTIGGVGAGMSKPSAMSAISSASRAARNGRRSASHAGGEARMSRAISRIAEECLRWRSPSGGSVRGESLGPSIMQSRLAVTACSTPDANHRLDPAERPKCSAAALPDLGSTQPAAPTRTPDPESAEHRRTCISTEPLTTW